MEKQNRIRNDVCGNDEQLANVRTLFYARGHGASAEQGVLSPDDPVVQVTRTMKTKEFDDVVHRKTRRIPMSQVYVSRNGQGKDIFHSPSQLGIQRQGQCTPRATPLTPTGSFILLCESL